jgi:outer membrane scaffolding protein for murein synthesis (MipA/OmpV family)
MSDHFRIGLARKIFLARSVGAVFAVVMLCGPLKAQQLDEVMVSSEKQTALDSEAISLSATPDAEPHLENGTSIIAGLGVLESPVYDGAKKSKASPFPYVDIHGWFHDRVYVSSVRGLGVNIVDDGPFRAGLALNYRGGRTSSDSDRLKGLPDIKGSPSIRGFVTYSLKPMTFELSVKNEFGSNPTTEVSFGTSVGFVPTPRLHLSVGADLSWVDSRFSRKYFGVTPAEAAQATSEGNSLTAYTPGSGLSTIGVTATGVYALSHHWGIVSRLGVSDIIGTPAKDSPLTQRNVGVSFGIGGIYKF